MQNFYKEFISISTPRYYFVLRQPYTSTEASKFFCLKFVKIRNGLFICFSHIYVSIRHTNTPILCLVRHYQQPKIPMFFSMVIPKKNSVL